MRNTQNNVPGQEAEEFQELHNSESTSKAYLNNYGLKDKQISAKVNSQMYALFTQINMAQGLSNNSALNVLISRYVRENKCILTEEDLR